MVVFNDSLSLLDHVTITYEFYNIRCAININLLDAKGLFIYML